MKYLFAIDYSNGDYAYVSPLFADKAAAVRSIHHFLDRPTLTPIIRRVTIIKYDSYGFPDDCEIYYEV